MMSGTDTDHKYYKNLWMQLDSVEMFPKTDQLLESETKGPPSGI